jgi:acetyl-CoA acyltransferase
MGSGKVFVCGGVESMTRVNTGFDPMPYPYTEKENPNVYFSMGITAENVAKKYNLTREAQQEFAISSHQKAFDAQSKGNFNNEITIIGNCSKDGNIRPNTSQETLDKLKLTFDQSGTITAATSSPLTDGAAATLICEEQFAKDNNLDILARIVSTSVQGCAPDVMGLGPIGASQKALERAKLTIKDIDIIELNEAFASQSLACIKDLGIDEEKVNLDGGALALGHPLGATGARITGKAAELLRRENKKYALATQCIGLGMGIATIIESVN